MSTAIGINGFGRIGRQVARASLGDPLAKVVAVNDLTDPKTLAHLFKYDSVHGRFPGAVGHDASSITADGQRFAVHAEREPEGIPWKRDGVSLVLECTGRFTDRAGASRHLAAGAKKVIISAPAKDPDVTLCCGINLDRYDPARHTILSNASCTTNCLAPVAKVLNDVFGIRRALMTTIHSYTNDQRILDLPHSDLRRARAAALSMIPTTTGAAKAATQVLPELAGKLDGMSIRVPTPNVSIVDLTAETDRPVTKESANAAMRAAAEGALRGILSYSDEPLVSVDYNGDPSSATVDADSTMTVGEHMVKIIAWYDNETGYTRRLWELARFVVERGM